jgi:myo-inositol-1(or 4)-monophosphatase
MSTRKNPTGPQRTSDGQLIGAKGGKPKTPKSPKTSETSAPPTDDAEALTSSFSAPSGNPVAAPTAALPAPRGAATQSPSFQHQLVAVAIRAARAGGAVLIAGLNRPLQIENKSEKASIVTQVDLDSQAAVFAAISEAFPTHAILGEEGNGGGSDSTYTWLVDPLDGTSNYAHGIPFSCVSVAVRDAEGVVAGAVFEPFRGELFHAVRGGGAWLGDQRLSVTDTPAIARALICTGLQSDDPEDIAGHGRRVVALHTHSRGARMLGSPALCLAYVAAGRIDAFFERNATYAWDVGAGSLLIGEAGGFCEDLDGGPLNFGPGIANVIGTNGKLHQELADLIAATDGTR